MLLSSQYFNDIPVMSLQTGRELAITESAVIDPRSLKIVAFMLSGDLLDTYPAALRIEDVREFAKAGFIIDSSDEIVIPSDILKLQEIIDFNFNIFGLSVIDDHKSKIGKVLDYTINTMTYEIEQLKVKPSLFKGLQVSEILIHRNQIIEVNNSRIVVRSPTVKAHKEMSELRPKLEYSNPFRTPAPDASPIETRR